MGEGKHCEIERKYLISYPDIDTLLKQQGVERWEIEQIYLTTEGPEDTRRVRRIETNGEIRYYKTFKRHISALSNEEDEGEIDREEFVRLSREAHPACRPIGKTRYRIPYAGHTLEFDVYPFWEDRAILEIELESEDEDAAIPDYARVIRDVSDDPRYKNRALAERIVWE